MYVFFLFNYCSGSFSPPQWEGSSVCERDIYFSDLSFFLWCFILKGLNWSHSTEGAVKGFSLFTHASKIVQFIFVWKKKKTSDNPDVKTKRMWICEPSVRWYKQCFLYMTFDKCIYCLKSLLGLMQTTYLHVVSGNVHTVPNDQDVHPLPLPP